MTISQPDLGPVKIDRATLSAGGKSVTVTVPDSGRAIFAMGGVTSDSVKLHIDSIRGEGFNLVGVSELGIPGAKATRAARTPTTLTRLFEGLDPRSRTTFAKTPLDVLLQRVQNTPAAADDSEIALRRVVSMPDERRYDATAKVRLQSGSLEQLYDRSAGYDGKATVTSSTFWFERPENRASQAADASATTGWVPGGLSPKGAWWQVTGAERAIPSVKITQKPGRAGASRTQWGARASVLVDGRKVGSGTLKPDTTSTIDLPGGTRGRIVRVIIDESAGRKGDDPARFTSIDTGLKLTKSDLGPFDERGENRCLRVATVDGAGVPMRLEDELAAGPNDAGTTWRSCTPVTLSAAAPLSSNTLRAMSAQERGSPEEVTL